MNGYHEARVARALVHHFCIKTHERFRELRLKSELGLEPLDLVLFVLDLEEPGSPAFDFATLGAVVTVGDLIGLVGAWLRVCDKSRPQDPHGVVRVA